MSLSEPRSVPTIVFTKNLKRHIDAPMQEVAATTVAQALERMLETNTRLGDHILDDQSRLRKHVAIFVDGRQIHDRENLSDPLRADSEIRVLEALSGG